MTKRTQAENKVLQFQLSQFRFAYQSSFCHLGMAVMNVNSLRFVDKVIASMMHVTVFVFFIYSMHCPLMEIQNFRSNRRIFVYTFCLINICLSLSDDD